MMEIFLQKFQKYHVKTNKKKAIESKFMVTRAMFYCQYNGIEHEQQAEEVKKIPRLSLELDSKIRIYQSQRKITGPYEKTVQTIKFT